MKRLKIYENRMKRVQDFVLALIALLTLWPLLVAVAIFVRIKLGSPVLFSQARPGKDTNIFKMYKFRTMIDAIDAEGNLLPDEVRITKFGKFLRATSLDELPELWNILRGDMAIVGPRPLLVEYLPLYNEQQRRRHLVRPGLTGYAQVNGRNAISWDEKFRYDVEYVDRISFKMDWSIILLTIKKVFVREGIHSSTSETMELFRGSDYVKDGLSDMKKGSVE